ncbi:hypothetical protein V5O48_017401 [Marasmius crinis-equi]|uniref:Uncharacterized protein n=1 Tax=Marasmius crinis-equi TaxID=585013 RepID=A0ABR3EP14_9AGAR
MPQGSGFLGTISVGIQSIAALLPLLGTEQCERHVGSALDKGIMYAAAAPLSIFGSLGVVTTAFATFVATFPSRRFGAGWLEDAGFRTAGSVSSMVTVLSGTMRYGAEDRLEKLLKEQHIDDLTLVSDIRLAGEKARMGNVNKLKRSLKWSDQTQWNTCLVLWSMAASIASLLPYIYLTCINNDWGELLAWLFPGLRSFGSLLCVVAVQFALQTRILYITKASFRLSRGRRQLRPLSPNQVEKDRERLLEERLEDIAGELKSRVEERKSRLDRHRRGIQVEEAKKIPKLEARLRTAKHELDEIEALLPPPRRDWALSPSQVCLVIGMGMVVVGYVGCFNRVNQTSAKVGPYGWLGLEVLLSLLRIFLWGWNPSLANNDGGMEMVFLLELDDGRPPTFPHLTTPYTLEQLTTPDMSRSLGWRKEDRESFVVENANHFLAAAASYRGPLPQLELENASLFIGIVPQWENADRSIKLLCVNACLDGSKSFSISFFIKRSGSSDSPHATYLSRSEKVPGKRAVRVVLEKQVYGHPDSIAYVDRQTHDRIVQYSFILFERLFARTPSDIRRLSWTVTFPAIPRIAQEVDTATSIPCTDSDVKYMHLRQRYDLKGEFCLRRGDLLLTVFIPLPANTVPLDPDTMIELGLVLDSVLMEIFLCVQEDDFIAHSNLSRDTRRLLRLEGTQKMVERITLDCEASQRRLGAPTRIRKTVKPDPDIKFIWGVLQRELISMRQVSPDSHELKHWKDCIERMINSSHQVPPVPVTMTVGDFLGHRPFDAPLLDTFREGLQSHWDKSTASFDNMILYMTSSLSRLHPGTIAGVQLPGHIGPYDRGSPEFTPPYRCVNGVTEGVLSALEHDFEHVKVLEVCGLSSLAASTLLDRLDVVPKRLTGKLTTMVFRDLILDTDDARQTILSILERQKAICVIYDKCSGAEAVPGYFTEGVGGVINNNREAWRQQAVDDGDPRYIFGIMRYGDPELQGDSSPYDTYMHDVLLSGRAQIFAMIYTPCAGSIVPILTLQAHKEDIDVVVFLRRAAQGINIPTTIGPVKHKVAVSYTFERVRFDGFQVDGPGQYELYINLTNVEPQYLFKDLEIIFPPPPETQERAEIQPPASG